MGIKRESFVFYRSFFDALMQLNDADCKGAIELISRYALDGKDDDKAGYSDMVRLMFTLIKPQIDKNLQRYENGKKGGAPKGNQNSKRSTKVQPKTTENNQKQPNDNVNVNDNDNVISIEISEEDRERIFIIFFLKNYENLDQEVEKFINHYKTQGWTRKGGAAITDVVALASSWTSEQNKRLPATFLKMWQESYEALGIKIMLTGLNKIEFKDEIIVVHATRELMDFIESQLPVFTPIFLKYYKKYKMAWKTPR